MSAMTALELDPNSVQAGVLPLVIVLAMGVIIALGYVSMRRHLRRISAPRAAELATTTVSVNGAEPPAAS